MSASVINALCILLLKQLKCIVLNEYVHLSCFSSRIHKPLIRDADICEILSVIKIYSVHANFVLKCNWRRDQIKVLVVHVAAEVVCLEL